MKNLDKHEWDFSKEEKQAIAFFEANGYGVTIRKRFISKDYITIEKDGLHMDIDFPLDNRIAYGSYLTALDKQFSMYKEYVALKEAALK